MKMVDVLYSQKEQFPDQKLPYNIPTRPHCPEANKDDLCACTQCRQTPHSLCIARLIFNLRSELISHHWSEILDNRCPMRSTAWPHDPSLGTATVCALQVLCQDSSKANLASMHVVDSQQLNHPSHTSSRILCHTSYWLPSQTTLNPREGIWAA